LSSANEDFVFVRKLGLAGRVCLLAPNVCGHLALTST